MRLGRATPWPRYSHPTAGLVSIAAGVVVLAAVGGVGGILVGCGFVAYGVGQLIMRTPSDPPRRRYHLPTDIAAAVPLPSRHERIVLERERRQRDRWIA